MTHSLVLSLLLLLSFTEATAQYHTNQNMVWAFGTSAGIDFSSGAPIDITTNINTFEASASVCDTSGNLMFYTDGKIVYDRMGAIMPYGASIVPYGTFSSREGALIAPVIGSPNKFYIFSVQHFEDPDPLKSKLSYTVVDMTLNGGLGDVDTTMRGILLEDSTSEVVISIQGNDNDIWIISGSRSYEFVIHRLTTAGIGSGVGYDFHPSSSYPRCGHGFLRANPSGTKIVDASPYDGFISPSGGLRLFDFDPGTGVISNSLLIDTTINPTSAEFSPDGTKLYVCASGVGILQYDLSVLSASAIYASKYLVCPNTSAYSYVRLAPNDKIYFTNILNNCMSCIDAPNNSGSSCNYILNTLDLSGTGSLGLPNVYVSAKEATTGIAEIAASGITVSPNPANSILTVSAPMKITHIVITNMLGQVVYNSEWGGDKVSQMNIAYLTPGIYCIKINGKVTRKFIKN